MTETNYASQLKIEIVNALGQTVKTDLFDCQSGSWNYSIVIGDLQSGVYTLKINSPDQTVFKNFIKE